MRKWISYVVPIVTLVIFILIMQGGYYYITSMSDKNTIPQYISIVENDVKADRWDNAKEDLNNLDLAWKKAIPKVQFHAEMDAIDGIKENLARLSGSIDAKDLGLSLAELRELAEHWENLKN
ncbi:MAG: hypothetical protein CVU90_01385 [Firmicutes bacterium HGW-Firmicutes-15]|nr:MAG: hypothetical protein CVU90_01385 [Firmicutes bacterium HGW-Firmicutes-15]